MLGYSDSNKESGSCRPRWMLHRRRPRWRRAPARGVELTLFHGRGGAHRARRRADQPGDPRPGARVGRRAPQAHRAGRGHRRQLRRPGHRRAPPRAADRRDLIASTPEHDAGASGALRAARRSWTSSPRRAGRATARSSTTTRVRRVLPRHHPDRGAVRLRSGSRPARARRGATRRRRSIALRAIPWTFAWSQARINLPGWYGLGPALEAYRGRHGEDGLDAWRGCRAMAVPVEPLDNAEMILAKADMGVARPYAALATGDGTTRRWDAIETEYHRTVALLLRVTGRDRLLDGAPVLQRSIALRNPYVDSLSELQVRLLARLRAMPPDDPSATRPAPRPAHGQRRRGRPPEHGLRAMDHADHVALLRAGGARPGGHVGRTSGPASGRSRWPSRTCSVRAAGSSRWIAIGGRCVRTPRRRRGFPATAFDDADRRSPEPLDLPPLDGLVAANSLHYVPRDRQVAAIRSLAGTFGRAGRSSSSSTTPTAAIRGCRTRSRAAAWERLADAAGLPRRPTGIGRVPSRFLGAIYAAVSRRASAVARAASMSSGSL
jgi:hypothetical protein